MTGLAVVTLCVSALLSSTVPAHAQALPTYLATFGGPGHAFVYPSGVAISPPDGDIVLADTGNDRVVKLDASGNVVCSIGSPGAGVGQFTGPRDVGVDPSGDIFVADDGSDNPAGGRIVKLDSNCNWLGEFGQKGSADFVGNPIGVSVSNNQVYVADPDRHEVHVFDTSGNPILHFGSNGVCSIGRLRDVDADASGNIFVANYDLNDILKFTSNGTCIETFGSQGTSWNQFKSPYGVAIGFDPQLGTQAVYVADSNNERIEEFDLNLTQRISSVASNPTTGSPYFVQLRRVAVDSAGNVWAADLWGYRAEEFSPQASAPATTYTYATTIGGTPPPLQNNAVFNQVRGVAFDNTGDVVTVDTVNQRIVTFDPTGNIVSSCGQRGDGSGQFNWPRGVAVDPATGNLWVANTRQNDLAVLQPGTCQTVETLGRLGPNLGQLNWPHSIAIRGSDETAWVADTLNNRVESWNVATGKPIATFNGVGNGNSIAFRLPRGIAVDPSSGDIYVADYQNNRIVELSDTNGSNIQFVRSISTLCPTKGTTCHLQKPSGVAVDSQGDIYIADTGHSQVAITDRNGNLIGDITSGGSPSMPLNQPENVAIDQATGNLYVADTYNDRVLEFTGA